MFLYLSVLSAHILVYHVQVWCTEGQKMVSNPWNWSYNICEHHVSSRAQTTVTFVEHQCFEPLKGALKYKNKNKKLSIWTSVLTLTRIIGGTEHELPTGLWQYGWFSQVDYGHKKPVSYDSVTQTSKPNLNNKNSTGLKAKALFVHVYGGLSQKSLTKAFEYLVPRW